MDPKDQTRVTGLVASIFICYNHLSQQPINDTSNISKTMKTDTLKLNSKDFKFKQMLRCQGYTVSFSFFLFLIVFKIKFLCVAMAVLKVPL